MILFKERKKYVYEHSYKVDGNAIKRIVKEIDKLCR